MVGAFSVFTNLRLDLSLKLYWGQWVNFRHNKLPDRQTHRQEAGAGGYLVWGLARVRARVKPQPRLGNFMKWHSKGHFVDMMDGQHTLCYQGPWLLELSTNLREVSQYRAGSFRMLTIAYLREQGSFKSLCLMKIQSNPHFVWHQKCEISIKIPLIKS